MPDFSPPFLVEEIDLVDCVFDGVLVAGLEVLSVGRMEEGARSMASLSSLVIFWRVGVVLISRFIGHNVEGVCIL